MTATTSATPGTAPLPEMELADTHPAGFHPYQPPPAAPAAPGPTSSTPAPTPTIASSSTPLTPQGADVPQAAPATPAEDPSFPGAASDRVLAA